MARYLFLFLMILISVPIHGANQKQIDRRQFLSRPGFQNNRTAEAHSKSGSMPPRFEDPVKQNEVDRNPDSIPMAVDLNEEQKSSGGPREKTGDVKEREPSSVKRTARDGLDRDPASSTPLRWGMYGFLALFALVLGWFFRKKR